MNGSTVFEEKVYVYRVKGKRNDWDGSDIAYGAVLEGSDGVSFSLFKHICEKLNKKWFVTRRASMEDSSCTWDEVKAAFQQCPCIGTPKVVSGESPVTFYRLAKLCYESGVFKNKEGLEKLNEIDGTTTGGTDTEEVNNFKDMMEQVRRQAAAIKDIHSSVKSSDISHSVEFVTGLNTEVVGGNSPKDVPGDDRGGDVEDKVVDKEVDLQAVVVEYKGKLAAAEEYIATQNISIAELNKKVTELEKNLADSQASLADAVAAQSAFMAESDKIAIENNNLVSGTASEIIEGLKPFIKQQLTNMTNCVDSQIEAGIEASNEGFQSLSGDLGDLKNSVLDIAESIKLIKENPPTPAAKTRLPVQSKPVHTGPCNFQLSPTQSNTLVCIDGCGSKYRLPAQSTGASAPEFDSTVPPPTLIPPTSAPSFIDTTNSTQLKELKSKSGTGGVSNASKQNFKPNYKQNNNKNTQKKPWMSNLPQKNPTQGQLNSGSLNYQQNTGIQSNQYRYIQSSPNTSLVSNQNMASQLVMQNQQPMQQQQPIHVQQLMQQPILQQQQPFMQQQQQPILQQQQMQQQPVLHQQMLQQPFQQQQMLQALQQQPFQQQQLVNQGSAMPQYSGQNMSH